MACSKHKSDAAIQSVIVDPDDPAAGWTPEQMRKAKPPNMIRKRPAPQDESIEKPATEE